MRQFALFGAALAVSVLAVNLARADEKLACVQAAENAQKLRAAWKLRDAREKLLACVHDACPALIRADCNQWLSEVDRSTPSVAFRAKDGEGRDLEDVRVTVDGVVVLHKLEGRAVALDPGEHDVVFEHAGSAPIKERLILAAGDKNRVVSASFGGAGGPRVIVDTPRTTEGDVREGPPAAAWFFGALTVVAAGSFAGFGITGKNELDGLRRDCLGHCDPGAVDSAWNKLIVADVSLGIGIVSAGLATYFFVKPRGVVRITNGVRIAPTRGGLGFGYSGSF